VDDEKLYKRSIFIRFGIPVERGTLLKIITLQAKEERDVVEKYYFIKA
jgi:hypothetical protein